MPARLPLLLLAAVAVAATGCAQSFIQLPPPATAKRPAGGAGSVRVTRASVSSGARERPAALAAAREALADYLASSFARGPVDAPPVWVEVQVDLSLSSSAAGFYRGMAPAFANPLLAPLLVWPLWPDSGKARLDARLTATRLDPATQLERRYELRLGVRVPYSIYWYGYARTGPRERAFRDGWRVLAEELSARLGVWLNGGAAGAPPLVGDLKLEVSEERSERPMPGSLVEERTLSAEDPNAWRVITAANQPEKKKPQSFLARYFSALGGVDVGYLMGKAWVSSDASDSFGQRYTIASGEATSRGYRIDLYTIPDRSTWFFHPTVGFLSLDIDIHDFRQSIPLASVPGAQEIEGVGSNPETGAPLDLTDPNVYRLFLRSFYIGQRLSATLVMGTPKVQLFATVEGGFNIIEFRYARVQIGRDEKTGWSFPWFFSGQVKAIAGIAIRPWHMALRIEGHYEAYRRYGFPEPLLFEGRVEYNAQKQLYERKNTSVESAAVGVANVFFSVNLYY